MEMSRLRHLASEKTLFDLTVLIMLLMPLSEVVTDILCNYSDVIFPSVFQPVILRLFGYLGTALVLLYKTCELTGPKSGRAWYAADVFYLVLVLFMALSAVFSVNFGVFSDGDVFVGETPAHFLAYFALFFFGSRIKSSEYRKKLIYAFLLIAAVQSVIAFFQTFNIEIAYCLLIRHDRAAYGLTQNSNYYGGLAVFLLACSSGAYLFSDKLFRSKAFLFILPVFSGFVFYSMMGSRARLAWIGFGVMMLFYLISGLVMLKGNIDKALLKKFFIRFAVLCAVFAAVFALTHLLTDFVSEEVERTQMEVEGKLDSGIGSDRLVVWKYGLQSIPHHWPTGIGLDNYTRAFFENPAYKTGDFYQAKAHNEYLHLLVTQGVFAFAFYVFVLIRAAVIAVRKVFKGGDEESQILTWIFLGMFITYAAQASLNCSVINVAMYFWLVLGLLDTCDRPLNFLFKRK